MAEEPITVKDLRTRLRLNTEDDDDLLNDIITEARSYVERYAGITLVERSRTQVFDDSERVRGQVSGYIGNRAPFRIAYPPVTEVTKVEQFDSLTEAWVELATTDYFFEEETRTLYITSWNLGMLEPTDLVRVTYTAGYTLRDDMPIDYKLAVMRYAVWSYDRTSGSNPPDLDLPRKVGL